MLLNIWQIGAIKSSSILAIPGCSVPMDVQTTYHRITWILKKTINNLILRQVLKRLLRLNS